MAMNCEVTGAAYQEGKELEPVGRPGGGPEGPQTQDPEKVIPGPLVLKMEP